MTSLTSRLSKCTANQLKSLAELIGVNTTATKTSLVSSLDAEIFRQPHIASLAGANGKLHRPTRILSIDMGIRNLAFCVLEVQESKKANSPNVEQAPMESISAIEDALKVTRSIFNSATLVAWKRTSLYDLLDEEEQSQTLDSTTHSSLPIEAKDLDDVSKSLTAKSSKPMSKQPAPKEAFDPATFASLTYKLVTRVFLPYNISHVLIERQRYRSASAPAIMEWTVRVNMLESMLHAVFGTLRNEAIPLSERAQKYEKSAAQDRLARSPTHGNDTLEVEELAIREAEPDVMSPRWNLSVPKVHSINPRKVGLFWDKIMPFRTNASQHHSKNAMEPDNSTAAKPPSRAKVEKEAKIAIVEHILTQEDTAPLQLSAEAEDARNAFLAVRNRKNGRSNGRAKSDAWATVSGGFSSSKLDDLADCLLQAAAWAQWEMNRVDLRESLQRLDVLVVDRPKKQTPAKKITTRRRATKNIDA